MNRLGLIIAVAALSASHSLIGTWAWHRGFAKAEARQVAATAALEGDLLTATRRASALQAALVASQNDRTTLIERIEDEARQDPDADSRRPGADSLRRLGTRWGTPS
ncbi:hypothetical protein [Seohaeicola zhoushanensis]|uniref:Uncharacterized protein n=1 Tax=Seohaeicola zhoushanensis TaxID=1569283 RepID=A0A8J3GT12_9RHOB|nr:hypothetical protein [Seohaeicola zhoushanensis]GHF33400.1 hypothetical protein GCM10017056_01020 [Seohaeicola zhoushanensis]